MLLRSVRRVTDVALSSWDWATSPQFASSSHEQQQSNNFRSPTSCGGQQHTGVTSPLRTRRRPVSRREPIPGSSMSDEVMPATKETVNVKPVPTCKNAKLMHDVSMHSSKSKTNGKPVSVGTTNGKQTRATSKKRKRDLRSSETSDTSSASSVASSSTSSDQHNSSSESEDGRKPSTTTHTKPKQVKHPTAHKMYGPKNQDKSASTPLINPGQENKQQQKSVCVKVPSRRKPASTTVTSKSAIPSDRMTPTTASLMSPTRVSKRLKLHAHGGMYASSNGTKNGLDCIVPLGSASAARAVSSFSAASGSSASDSSRTNADCSNSSSSDCEMNERKAMPDVGFRLRDPTERQALVYGNVTRLTDTDAASAGNYLPAIKTAEQERSYCEYDADLADVKFVEEFMLAHGLTPTKAANTNNIEKKKADVSVPSRPERGPRRRAATAAKTKIKNDAGAGACGPANRSANTGGNVKQNKVKEALIESLEQSFSQLDHELRQAIHSTVKANGKRQSMVFAHVLNGQRHGKQSQDIKEEEQRQQVVLGMNRTEYEAKMSGKNKKVEEEQKQQQQEANSGNGACSSSGHICEDADTDVIAADALENACRERRRNEMKQAGKTFVNLDKSMIESLVPYSSVIDTMLGNGHIKTPDILKEKRKRGWPKGKPRGKRITTIEAEAAVTEEPVVPDTPVPVNSNRSIDDVPVKKKRGWPKGKPRGKKGQPKPYSTSTTTTTYTYTSSTSTSTSTSETSATTTSASNSKLTEFGLAVYERWVSLHVEQGPLVHCWQLHPTLEHWSRRCGPMGLSNEAKVE